MRKTSRIHWKIQNLPTLDTMLTTKETEETGKCGDLQESIIIIIIITPGHDKRHRREREMR